MGSSVRRKEPRIDDKMVDEQGSEHRQADYLVLKALEQAGPCDQDHLEEVVMHLVDGLITNEIESPINFRSSSSPTGVFSRDFLEALDRGIRMGRISETNLGEYTLTERGEEFLEDEEKLQNYGISETLREVIEPILE